MLVCIVVGGQLVYCSNTVGVAVAAALPVVHSSTPTWLSDSIIHA